MSFKQPFKKFSMFNVLMTMEQMDEISFDKIIREYKLYQRHEASELFEQSLNLEMKDQDWAIKWLKVNFSNVQENFTKLR